MNRMMKAIGFNEYGSAEVLQLLELPIPTITADQVLVRVVAAGVNPADWVIRSGQLKFFVKLSFPFICGADVAGIVERVGSNVGGFKVGDMVYAMLPNIGGGGYAEYVSVNQDALALIPAHISFTAAAAVPLASLTAYQALCDHAQLRANQQVLIYGGSGGVGLFAVQIAKAMGAQVTATCSTRNLNLVRDFGADQVLDYSQTDVSAVQAHYDVIFDAVGLIPFHKWQGALRSKGTVVTVNPILGNPLQAFLSRFDSQGRRLKAFMVKPNGVDLRQISVWIADGVVKPHLDGVYQLTVAGVQEAHRYSETKRVRGKLVLVVDNKLAHMTTDTRLKPV